MLGDFLAPALQLLYHTDANCSMPGAYCTVAQPPPPIVTVNCRARSAPPQSVRGQMDGTIDVCGCYKSASATQSAADPTPASQLQQFQRETKNYIA